MKRRGTSFVEIAIATVFLALAMVPMIDSILQGQRRVGQDRRRVFVTALATSAIERLRLESPATVATVLTSIETDEVLRPPDAPDSWNALRDQCRVSATFDGGAPGVLTVTVTWEENGVEREVELSTVLAPTFAPTGGA